MQCLDTAIFMLHHYILLMDNSLCKDLFKCYLSILTKDKEH